MKICSDGRVRWNELDKELFKAVYPLGSKLDILAKFPGQSWSALQMHASHFGLKRPYRPPMKEEKICKECLVLKSREEFDLSSNGGRRGYCRVCYRKVRYRREKADPARHRKNLDRQRGSTARRRCHLRFQYGISLEDYDRMYEQQKGCCAVCGLYKVQLCIDHDHQIKGIRGLLCSACNTLLGFLEKRPGWIQLAEKYLGKNLYV